MPTVDKAQEYDVLHAELAQNKKYVFERPFVILGVGIGLATYLGPKYGAALLVLFIGMLIFDYLFTVDRLRSNCRIIAYIHVVLESRRKSRGWETSLREYRIWTWEDRKGRRKAFWKGFWKGHWKGLWKGLCGDRNRHIVDAEATLKTNGLAVPVKSGHWRPILRIHGILVSLSLIGGVLLTWVVSSVPSVPSEPSEPSEPIWMKITLTVALALEGIVFARLSWKFRSSKMISLVERDIVLWNGALDTTAMRRWRALIRKEAEEKTKKADTNRKGKGTGS